MISAKAAGYFELQSISFRKTRIRNDHFSL